MIHIFRLLTDFKSYTNIQNIRSYVKLKQALEKTKISAKQKVFGKESNNLIVNIIIKNEYRYTSLV